MEAMKSRLVEYMKWADDGVLGALEGAPQAGRALALFAHVLAADRIWLMRLQGADPRGRAVWPEMTLEQCREESEALHQARATYLRGLSGLAGDGAMVSYRNQAGTEFSNAVADVLVHVLTRGAYHRGQVALALKEAGADPVNTDFIAFARERGIAA